MTPSDLRALLARHNMSQMDLARLLGVHPRTVRRWVYNGRDEIPDGAVMRLKLAKIVNPPSKPKTRRDLAPGEFPGPGS
jgi:DNA-binding transcriptional regulator YiaG